MESWFILCLSVLVPAGMAIETDTCGSTKHCVHFPEGCSPTDSTCSFFSYKWSFQTSTFTMELSGSTGLGNEYLAVGFAHSTKMRDVDVYYCTGMVFGTSTIQSWHSHPVDDSILPKGVEILSVKTNGGVAQCTFIRPASVTKTTSKGSEVFDLSSTKYHILLATGLIRSGTMTKHSSHWSSPSSRSFVALPGAGESSADDCGNAVGCYKSTSGCTPGTDGCLSVTWKHQEATKDFVFELTGEPNKEYVAMAFSTDRLMTDADLYYCSSTRIKSGTIQQRHAKPTIDTGTKGLSKKMQSFANGVVVCSFTRDTNVTKTVSGGRSKLFNLAASKYYLLLASGPLARDRNVRRHITFSSSPIPFDFKSVNRGSNIMLDSPLLALMLMVLSGIFCTEM